LFKVGKKLPLNQGDQYLLKDVLPKLQAAVEKNEQLGESEKNKFCRMFSKLRKRGKNNKSVQRERPRTQEDDQ
jgi:hypothetical protein